MTITESLICFSVSSITFYNGNNRKFKISLFIKIGSQQTIMLKYFICLDSFPQNRRFDLSQLNGPVLTVFIQDS